MTNGRDKGRNNWGSLVVVAVIVITIALAYLSYKHQPPNIDRVTNCPKDGSPASVSIVLVDASDTLDVVQRTHIENELTRQIRNVAQYGEIQLYTLASGGDALLKPVAIACNPGTGKGEGPWNSSPRLTKRHWETRFSEPLHKQLEKLMYQPPTGNSPILESIQQLGVSVFGRPEFDSVPKQLVIVSDMVQNTPGFSQYRHIEPFSEFRKTGYYLTVRPSLRGVDVRILYVRRPGLLSIQGRRHIEFWQSYFTDAGSTVSNVTDING